MTVSPRARDRYESKARGAISRAFSSSRSRVQAGRAPDWRQMENALLRELGPVMIDAQRASAIDMLRRTMHPAALRAKGWTEGRIEAAQKRVNAKIDEWRSDFPARGTNALSAASQIVSNTRERWHSFKGSYKGKPPVKGFRAFAKNGFGRSRAQRIAVTEITTSLTDGENIGKAYLRNTFRQGWDGVWLTREDERVCPICGPLHETPQEIWRKEFPKGPPAHVNCRCEIAWISVDF